MSPRGYSFGPLGSDGGVSPSSAALRGPRGKLLPFGLLVNTHPVDAALGRVEPDVDITDVEWKLKEGFTAPTDIFTGIDVLCTPLPIMLVEPAPSDPMERYVAGEV